MGFKSCSKSAKTLLFHSPAQTRVHSPDLIFHTKKSRDQTSVLLSVLWSRGPLKDLKDPKLILNETNDHLGSVSYHSEPSSALSPQTSNFSRTIFCQFLQQISSIACCMLCWSSLNQFMGHLGRVTCTRDVTTGATGATAVAPKFSDNLTLSQPRGADSAHH